MQVSLLPPTAFTRRIISAKPRVIKAARAFIPNPKPSPIPAAIANTFFTAPPSSTPIKSSLAYTRIFPWWNAVCTRWQNSGAVLATVKAQGKPSPTSRAKLGPDKTPTACAWVANRSCSRPTIWWGSREVLGSSPLQSHKILNGCCAVLKTSAAVLANPAIGVAITNRSFAPNRLTAFSKSDSINNALGRTTAGKYCLFSCSLRIASAAFGLRAHRQTGWWLAADIAMAVPHAPAPSTDIFISWAK